jgi:DNA-binding IclR family transcriptional regulator
MGRRLLGFDKDGKARWSREIPAAEKLAALKPWQPAEVLALRQELARMREEGLAVVHCRGCQCFA